jgi:orotidine-5'-phosphate decarboxylase
MQPDPYGYGPLGAVVGATYPHELAAARERLPASVLLVPGYGAQGGTAQDVVGAFDARGLGAVVNASRSLFYPGRGDGIAEAARAAATAMRDDLNAALATRAG